MTVRSSVLAWRIAWTKEPGGLRSVVSHRVGHDWGTENACPQYVAYMSNPGAPVLWLPNEWLGIINSCPLSRLPKWWLAEALKKYWYLFIYLVAPGFSCSMQDLSSSLWHVGSFHFGVRTLGCSMNTVPCTIQWVLVVYLFYTYYRVSGFSNLFYWSIVDFAIF